MTMTDIRHLHPTSDPARAAVAMGQLEWLARHYDLDAEDRAGIRRSVYRIMRVGVARMVARVTPRARRCRGAAVRVRARRSRVRTSRASGGNNAGSDGDGDAPSHTVATVCLGGAQ